MYNLVNQEGILLAGQVVQPCPRQSSWSPQPGLHFSVSNHSHQPHPWNLSNSPTECMTTSKPSRSSLGAGFALQQVLIAKEQPHQPETADHGRDGVDWRASEDWTPLFRRSSVAAGIISARQQNPAQPVDCLDRLLAKMEGSNGEAVPPLV
ncbi:hypothetical protein PGT21_025445 [Puccinia graminis f. sp. tritici]|uniref:Uncharacterized protein n=1 Tax=Puccinia graminis f. sp. tritici TaxID=56615 RepID=A0A5B0N9J6_PUCGR|nr:hypothetical protein PGT21_025445 [Puccinia graminis f. sp. tritici]KAA1113799.1 hypothetical protein PGTUg99_021941 [Puccinia graminis f. sp. tritici]